MTKGEKYTRQPNHKPAGNGGNRGTYTRSRTAFHWGEVEREIIGQFVQEVCDSGRGLVLGRTSDGGALSVTILDGDERIREWPNSPDEFVRLATWASTQFGDEALYPTP